MQKVKELQDNLKGLSTTDVVKTSFDYFGEDITFATSLGLEDQVLTDMIIKSNPSANIFTLDTGRIHQETYDCLSSTRKHYGIEINVFSPNQNDLQELIKSKGPNSFYDSIENRKECCGVRKMEPLKRALQEKKAWFVGLRRLQSITRKDLELVEWDGQNDLIKISPLWDWSTDQLWNYIKNNNVPYNKLHDQGFPSIGCAPCTRAIDSGEDERSGRWWWELPEQKECGLHFKDGKLVRVKK